MTNNWYGVYTILKREIKRTIKIVNQVVWPPIISTLLYAFVFGISLGPRIQDINGVPYLQFLIPGLIIMTVIDNSYGEGSASLFIAKFMNSIQEMLISPLSSFEIVLGYLGGSVLRGVVIGNIIFLLGYFIVGITIKHIVIYFIIMILVSLIFSSIGLVVALWAETFDHLAILSTFFITPLVFFGGVFHSITMLPEKLQLISTYNPLFYMIDVFRYSITGQSDASIVTGFIVVIVLTIVTFLFSLYMFSKGTKLRN
jgi:ABC-2 type transport system permease protein